MENYRLSEGTAEALALLEKHEKQVQAVEEAVRAIIRDPEEANERVIEYYRLAEAERRFITNIIGVSVAYNATRPTDEKIL